MVSHSADRGKAGAAYTDVEEAKPQLLMEAKKQAATEALGRAVRVRHNEVLHNAAKMRRLPNTGLKYIKVEA